MEMPVLQVECRTEFGARAAWRLRRAGRLPAVVYGEGAEAQPVSIGAHDFGTLVRHHGRVVQLDFQGRREKVLVQEIQWDALGDAPRHVDFLRIGHHATVEVRVPIEFVGHPKGLSHGGEFIKQMKDLPVSCAPEAIPASIPLKVADLDVGTALRVKDLSLPAGVRCLASAEEIVCSVNLRGVHVLETPAEAAVEPEAAEPEVIGKGKKEAEEAPAEA